MPFLLVVLLLPGCSNPTYPDFEPQDVVYQFRVAKTEHGEITAKPSEGITGTRINITINPDSGYIIKAKSMLIGDLKPNGQNYEMADRPPFQYLMASTNVSIKAEFIKVPAGNYTVHIAPLEHGVIQAIPYYGPPGTVVTLVVTPDAGYALKEGSLKNNGMAVTGDRYEIRIPANQHAIVSAEFEKTNAVSYIASGKRAIRNDNYDAAAELFEAAYQDDPSNAEAILYSSFWQLAAHMVSPRVRSLLNQLIHPGNALPSSISQIFITSTDPLVSGSWLRRYDGWLLPVSDGPRGFTSGFSNFPLQHPDIYQDEEGNANLKRLKLYIIMHILRMNANTDEFGMNKMGNPNGFNNYLDDLLKYVFGDSFEEICKRVERLDPNSRIAIDSVILEKFKGFLEIFGLENAYTGNGVFLGRAELEAVLSWLRLVKASVEFLSSYNWEIDTSFIKVRYMSLEPEDLETINGILNQFLFQPDFGLEDKFKNLGFVDTGLLSRMLPFRNKKFLTVRNSGAMNMARADYIKALTKLKESYAYYYSADAQVASQSKDLLLTKYSWLKGGVESLLQEVSSGGNFIVPKSFPTGGSWADATMGAKYTVNMSRLFTPGQFALARLVSSEQKGKAVKFFGFNADGSGGTVINRQSEISQFGGIGLEINMNSIKEVFVRGFEGYGNGNEWLHSLLPGALLEIENGGKLYEYYQTW
jgi:hypothetical protein